MQCTSPEPIVLKDSSWFRLNPKLSLYKSVFPLALLLLVGILSVLELSGTSIGMLDSQANGSIQSHGLLAGTPRPIRSDEWNLQTPLVVAQSHHAFSQNMQVGLGQHDLAVIGDIPNRNWSTVFKPWNIPALFIDVSHGFAARWWLLSFILIVGIYLLLLELTDRIDVAIFFSLGLYLSPMFQWWYQPYGFGAVGMGALAAAFFLWGLNSRTISRQICSILGCAWAAVGFLLILYPPYQIPLAYIFVLIILSEVVARFFLRSLNFKTIVIIGASVATLVAVIVGIFFIQERSVFSAIAATEYPGHRRESGGSGLITQLLSAPFGYPLIKNGAGLAGTNQSEISSFLLLFPFALLQLIIYPFKRFDYRTRCLLVGTSIATAISMIWFLTGFPSFLSSLLLLDYVETPRVVMGIGVGGFILMALLFASKSREATITSTSFTPHFKRIFSNRVLFGAFASLILSFGLYFWGGRLISQSSPLLLLGNRKIFFFSLFGAITIGLLCARKIWLGGLSLVLFGLVAAGTVNPIYQGLQPLTGPSISGVYRSIANSTNGGVNAVWLSYGDYTITDPLIASGLPTVNGWQPYPDTTFWKSIDPVKTDEPAWNRYGQFAYQQGPFGSGLVISNPVRDVISLQFDPCGTTSEKLHIGFLVSPTPMNNICFSLATQKNYLGSEVYIYRKR